MKDLTLLEALTLMASGKEVTLKFEAPASEFTVADLIKLESEGAEFFSVPETISNPEPKMSFAEMLCEEPPVPAITSPPIQKNRRPQESVNGSIEEKCGHCTTQDGRTKKLQKKSDVLNGAFVRY